jgi:hypothetical protein
MEGDRAYFIRRAAEERAAAVSATHPDARRSHFEMADRYDDLAMNIGDDQPGSLDSPVLNRQS